MLDACGFPFTLYKYTVVMQYVDIAQFEKEICKKIYENVCLDSWN